MFAFLHRGWVRAGECEKGTSLIQLPPFTSERGSVYHRLLPPRECRGDYLEEIPKKNDEEKWYLKKKMQT
jgi:hypothetical protein